MTGVGAALRMLVTQDAFKACVRRLLLMTIVAGIPDSRMVRCAVADGEEVVVREK